MEYSASHDGDARIMMTEAYTDINSTMRYYGDASGTRLGAHFGFNFQFITSLNIQSTVGDIINCVDTWLNHMPSIYTANWVLGNHDNHRVATRLGVQNVDGFNMLLALLPEVQVTYNGEEIEMEDGAVTYAQGMDPSACNNDEELFDSVSRDFERTPFHWDSTKNAGFSDANSTWLPVSSKYLTNNLALQSREGVRSNYHVYQELLSLRSTSLPLQQGALSKRAYSDNVLVLERTSGNERVFLVSNIGTAVETLSLTNLGEELTVLIPSSNSARFKGDIIQPNKFTLAPHESLVLHQTINSENTTGGSTAKPNSSSRLHLQITMYLFVCLCGYLLL